MSRTQRERSLSAQTRLQLVQGDLTEAKVDAIVNAANRHLQHGGGVAGAITRRGGYVIQQESDAWVQAHGTVSHAEPAWTSAGKLPCRYVIHSVGPIWGSGDEDSKLKAAVKGSLALADRLSLQSVAFPAISTGIYGFPKRRAAQIMLETIPAYFDETPDSGLSLVQIALIDLATLQAFLDVWDARWPGSG
jgi:O-acetyl-ADP-ribose deacetylase (regulator of RNase III)